MVKDTGNRPSWADSPLYEQGVGHFETEEWEEAVAVFSQLAAQFPDDQELKQILADLRFKASLPRGETRRGRIRLRRLDRPALIALVAVAVIAVLAGVSYAVYANWLLPARELREQAARIRDLHTSARGYMAAGDYTRTAELYREILSEAPDDATAAAGLERAEELQELAVAYDRALQLTQEEKWYEALWAWRMIRAVDTNFRDVNYWIAFVEQQDVLYSLFIEAEIRYEAQDWSGTVEILEQLRGQNPNYRRDDVEALLVTSLVNLAKQMLKDAADPADVHSQVMELFDRAIQIQPRDESLPQEKAVADAYSQSFARFKENNCEGSLQELQAVYGDEPHGSGAQQFVVIYQANIRCGDERMQARDFQGARTCYEAALGLPVDDVSEANSKYAVLVPMLTPTATPRPPTATPTRRPATPTPTATVPTWPYAQLGETVYRPNDKNRAECDWLGVGGQVFDAAGNGLSGIRIRVWSGGYEWPMVTSGSKAEYGPGGWEVPLYDQPRAMTVNCQVIDANGAGLSPVVVFDTYRGCNTNLVLINFKKTS